MSAPISLMWVSKCHCRSTERSEWFIEFLGYSLWYINVEMINEIFKRFILTNNFRHARFLRQKCGITPARNNVRVLKLTTSLTTCGHVTCSRRFYSANESLYDKDLLERYLEAVEHSVKDAEVDNHGRQTFYDKRNSLLSVHSEYKKAVEEVRELKCLRSGKQSNIWERVALFAVSVCNSVWLWYRLSG